MKRWLPTRLRGLSSQVKKWLLISVVSLLIILFVYPSAFIYPQDTLPDRNDTRLIAYILGQVQQNLLEHRPLHYGTYFATDQNTLAYSDLFLTSAILTLPFHLVTNSPIVIFNLALILSFLLTILSSFLLFKYLFHDLWVTILTVFLFNFSGIHLHYLPHLQIFSLWPLLLSLYFFLRFQKENRPLFLTLFFCASTLQMAESIFPVYLIFFAITIIVIAKHVVLKQSRISGSPRRVLLAMTKFSLPFIPVWIFLLYPYYYLHISLQEASRPIRDASHFSLGVDQIFTQFHSWTVIFLVIASLLSKAWQSRQKPISNLSSSRMRAVGPRRGRSIKSVPYSYRFPIRSGMTNDITFWRGPKRHIFDPWQYIFLFSIIMSLGPVLKIFGTNLRIFGFPIPLPYTLFYYLFPGFTGFRTPSRFIILALLALVILIGYYLKPIFSKLKSKTKLVFLLLVLSLLLTEADLPLKAYPVNINMHPVYQEVKALPPEAVILELPIKLWNMSDHEIESIRSLYSLVHRHRRFGGFSGFATNSWISLVEKINTYGLNMDNVTRLKSLGVTHIIDRNQITVLR